MKTIICLFLLSFLSACSYEKTSDDLLNEQQEMTSKQAAQAVGMPSIVNFQEKRTLKQIIELRDTKIRTFTYILDLNGRRHKLCDSIGYGFSAATQYTSPQKIVRQFNRNQVLPQADPNGLFSPATAEGTYILCLDPKTKQALPVYTEPRIIVSPFEMSTR
jgi:hypothetical protein